MSKKNKDDEATEEVNAPEPTEEESSSDKENLEETSEIAEEEVESKPEPKEEVAEDYLEEDRAEVSYKKRYGDSTREYQTLKRTTEDQSQAIKNLDRYSKANPRIEEEIEKAKALVGETDENFSTNNSTLVQRQIDEALEPVKKVAQDIQNRERLSKIKVLANFEKKNPNLFSAKATQNDKREIRQRIGKVANALVDSGMEFPEAVNRAYLTVNPKAAVQKGKDQAYLESLDEEQAGFSSQTSTEGKQPTEPKYSKNELKIGDKMGVGKAMRKDKS